MVGGHAHRPLRHSSVRPPTIRPRRTVEAGARMSLEALALRSPVESVPAAEPPSNVARAAAGDVRAFEHLYRTHLPRVNSLVRRMTAGRDADELTQDVFVRVWQKLGTFRGDSSRCRRSRRSPKPGRPCSPPGTSIRATTKRSRISSRRSRREDRNWIPRRSRSSSPTSPSSTRRSTTPARRSIPITS